MEKDKIREREINKLALLGERIGHPVRIPAGRSRGSEEMTIYLCKFSTNEIIRLREFLEKK